MSGFLRFAYDPDGREVVLETFWNGEWPPPDHLYLASGVTSGRMYATDEASIQTTKAQYPDFNEHVVVQRCKRVKVSTMDEEVGTVAGMPAIRGALYVPEGIAHEQVSS